MPRFFFDLVEDGTLKADAEGLELSGPEEARLAALVTLPEMARDLAPGSDDQELVTTVRDEARPLFRLSLRLLCERL